MTRRDVVLVAAACVSLAVYVGAQATVNGVQNQNVLQQGQQVLYAPNGTILTAARCVQSLVTSNSTTGQWSLSYTALGFTTITSYRADPLSPTTSQVLLSNQVVSHINSVSTTQITGTVTNNTTLTIAGISVTGITFLSGATSQVSVGVCGT